MVCFLNSFMPFSFGHKKRVSFAFLIKGPRVRGRKAARAHALDARLRLAPVALLDGLFTYHVALYKEVDPMCD